MSSTDRTRHPVLNVVLGALLGTSSGLAASAPPVADPAAGGANVPVISVAPNGVPVVNIAAPSAAGLSHNRYQSFNVDANGLVFNNSTTVAQSQLGGAMLANPQLGGRAASVILNEVTQANRSALNGFQEIHGAPAEYVLANPYGITCNGCGFINTPRATLTTGEPDVGGGVLRGFRVRQGDIAIEGAGLDATRQQTFDLLARNVTVAAQINANDLGVVAGSNDVDYASRTATAVTATGAAPSAAIDTALLGGMYANRIRLLATEQGVGVKIAGEAAASVDDLTLSAAGKLELSGKLSATRDLGVTATAGSAGTTAIDVSGSSTGTSLFAGRNTTLNAGGGALALGAGKVGASGALTLSGDDVTDTGTAADQRFAGTALTVAAVDRLGIDGANYDAGANLVLGAGRVDLGTGGTKLVGARNSGSVAVSSAGDLDLGNASITSPRAIALSAGGGLTTVESGGEVTAGDDLSLGIGGALNNAGSLRANDAVTVRSTVNGADLSVSNLATGVIEAKGALSIANQNGAAAAGEDLAVTNAAGGAIAGGTVDLRGTSLNNAGTVQGTTSSQLALATLTNQGGAKIITSTAAGAASSITTSDTFTNQGATHGTGNLSITAPTLANSGTVTSGATLALTGETVNNTGTGTLQGATALNATLTGDLNNTGATAKIIAGTAAGGSSTLTARHASNSGVIHSAGNLTLDAVQITNAATGGISALGNLALNATRSPAGTPNTNDITNRGLLFALGNLDAFASRSIANLSTVVGSTVTQKGEILADGDISLGRRLADIAQAALFGSRVFTNEGLVESDAGDVTIVADTINNAIPAPTINSSASSTETDLNDSGRFAESNVDLCSDAEEFFGCGDHDSRNDGDYYIVLDRFLEKKFSDYRETRVTTQTFSGLSPLRPQLTAFDTLKMAGFDSVLNTGGTLSGATVDLVGRNGAATVTNQAITRFQITEQRFFREKWDCPDVACVGSHSDHDFEGDVDFTSFTETNRTTLESVPAGIRAGTLLGVFSLVNLGSPLLPTNESSPAPGTSSAPGALSLGGLNLTLPSNPNGFFIVSQNPNSRFLVETNPLFTSLESPFLGSDHLARALGLDPETLTRRLGNDAYEARLIREQLIAQTGLDLLRGASSKEDQVKQLLDNAAWAAGDLKLSYGVALTQEQVNALKQDIVWMVETEVNGQTVLAPVVYLSSATRAGLDGANIVVDNMAISGDTLSNTGGTIDVANTMEVTTRGDITNTSGNIRGGNVDLTSTDGSIVNQTAVTRFGDDEEFQDQAGRTGTITARQDLSLDAAQDILNRGGNIDVGGDASLNAGGDIRSEALALESRTREYSLDGNLIERTETTTITEETTHQKAGISIGGNLDATAGNTFALVGSDTNVAGNANIEATDIDIRNVTDSRTVTTEESQRGFNTEAGLEEGKDTQYRAGVSYDTRDTMTSTTDTTVVGSGLKVGGDLGLKGTNTITVTGSDVESGGDMNIETKRLLTQAAEQGTQTTSSEMTTSTGVYATGGGDRAGWGIQSDIGKTDSESWDMTARGSTLKSGGNMTRNVEGGTITDIGTQIEAGGDFTQTADTIESLAAEDRKGSTTSSTTASMNWETGARYEGEQAYDDAVEGSSASINPRLEQGMKTTTTMTDTSESSTRAVVSTIRAGGNVNSTSTGKTTLEGTAIDAGKDVNLNAGELEFKAAEDTYTRTENVEVVGTEMKANFDTSASVGVSLGADYAEASGTEQGSNAVVGSIRSGGNTNVNTTGDATFVGTNINAGNEANISAGGDVDYQAARDTYSNSTESVQGGGEIGASVSITGTSGSVSLAGYGGDGSSSEDSSIARAGSINAGNGVNIKAGNDNDLRLEGTNVAGGAGDVNLSAGRDIKLDAAESTFSSTDQETYAGAGLTVGNESKSGGGSSQSLGVEAEVDYKDNSASGSVQQGGLITGNNVNINAGRDVRAQGTGVVAENNASVSAGRDVSYQAATSTFTSDTTEVGVGLSLELSKESSGKGSAGTGSNAGTSTASAGGSSAGGGNSSGGASVDGMGGKLNVTVGSSDVMQQQGGFIVGKNVDVSAGRDIAMVGTQVGAADSASLTAGRDITLESAQSTERGDNVNVGLQGEFSAGDSSTGAVAGIDIGVDKVDNLTNQNASISGNKVTVKSGNDLTMRGANVSGNEVEADVGGDLTIESRADRTDETHVGVELYAGGFVPSSNEGGGSNNETASDGRTGSNSPKVGSSGTYSEAKGKLGEAIDTGGQISRTGAAAGLYVSDQDTVEVKQQSGITGGSSTRVNVGGSTALTGARIGSEPGGTTEFSSAGPVTMGSVAEHDRRGGIDIGFSAKPGADIGEGPITEVLPDVGTDRGDDIGARANLMPIVNTSSTVGSSIGTAATPTPGAIQGSLSPQTVTQVLTQPAVQTSVKLTKGVDGAVASFGSLAQVPDATKRSLLAQAGVPVPENVDGPTLDLMIVSGIEQGREAASAGFADSNMSPAQQANLLRTIGLGAR